MIDGLWRINDKCITMKAEVVEWFPNTTTRPISNLTSFWNFRRDRLMSCCHDVQPMSWSLLSKSQIYHHSNIFLILLLLRLFLTIDADYPLECVRNHFVGFFFQKDEKVSRVTKPRGLPLFSYFKTAPVQGYDHEVIGFCTIVS